MVFPSSKRVARWRATVMAGAFALVTLGATGCSGNPEVLGARQATVAPSASVSARTTPRASAPRRATPSAARSAKGVAKAANLVRSRPVRLQIAAIGVNSDLMALGLRANGSMQVPPGGFPAGWYTGGPTPGELGPAVIAGHVDTRGPGVFYRLHRMRPGDLVKITRADGSKPVFRVKRVGQYPKHQFPTGLVYGDIDRPGLRLITCGGSFNSQSGHYDDNIVVFADLVTPSG